MFHGCLRSLVIISFLSPLFLQNEPVFTFVSPCVAWSLKVQSSRGLWLFSFLSPSALSTVFSTAPVPSSPLHWDNCLWMCVRVLPVHPALSELLLFNVSQVIFLKQIWTCQRPALEIENVSMTYRGSLHSTAGPSCLASGLFSGLIIFWHTPCFHFPTHTRTLFPHLFAHVFPASQALCLVKSYSLIHSQTWFPDVCQKP